MSKFSGVCCIAMALCGCLQDAALDAAEPTAKPDPLVVFVVRHAEKAEGGRDPVLSEQGNVRAKVLATTLSSAGIQHIHSTDYRRTMLTAFPVAQATKLKVQTYDPRKLSDFAASVRTTGGRHLVVGHSNTTPALVKLLGGDPGKPIDEQSEYDRLYVVTIASNGESSCVLIRYGQSSKE